MFREVIVLVCMYREMIVLVCMLRDVIALVSGGCAQDTNLLVSRR